MRERLRTNVARLAAAALAIVSVVLFLLPASGARAVTGTAGPIDVTVTPTTNLQSGDVISIHGQFPAGVVGTMNAMTAHICLTPAGGPISNSADFGFQGPYCVKFDGIAVGSLGANTVANYENQVLLANTTSGDVTFTAGTGSVGWLDDNGSPHTLTCDAAHPCDLVVEFQISVAPNTVYFTAPLTYAGGGETTTTVNTTLPSSTTTTSTTTSSPASTTTTTTSTTTTTHPPTTTTSSTTTTTSSVPSSTTTTTTTLPAGSVQGTPAPGTAISATLPGFGANTQVTGTLHSDPVALGSVQADGSGVATFAFTVPLDFTGQHSVEGVGTDSQGDPITVTASFVVVSGSGATVSAGGTTSSGSTTGSSGSGALAFTGANTRDVVSVALLMLAAGLLLLDFGYRRRLRS